LGDSRKVLELSIPEVPKDLPLPEPSAPRLHPGTEKVPEKSPGLAWSSNLNEALKEGLKLKRPVLLVFTSQFSTQAKLDEAVLKSRTVRLALQEFVRVKLYTDLVPDHPASGQPGEQARAQQASHNLELQRAAFGTEALPLYLVLKPTPSGGYEVLARHEGSFGGDREAAVRFLANRPKRP